MKANKKRHSKPELLVRRMLHSLGYRYRLYARDIPGNPDIVFHRRRKVIFVHGCFWHQHQDARCPLQTHPKSNVHYWKPKLLRNRQRDRINQKRIIAMGWDLLIVWECELVDAPSLRRRLKHFLSKLDCESGANGLRLRPGQSESNVAGMLGPGITSFRSQRNLTS